MARIQIRSTDIRRGFRDILDHITRGDEVVIAHYGRPVAIIAPYKETALAYCIEVQASDAERRIWQTVAVHYSGDHADPVELAADVAANQNIAEGDAWRVRITRTAPGVEGAWIVDHYADGTVTHNPALAVAKTA